VEGLYNLEYIYLIPITLSAALSIRSFSLKWKKSFKIFSILLCITLIIELFAISWEWDFYKNNIWNLPQSNLWIYNGFTTVRHIFLMTFFYYIINSPILKKMILWTSFIFFIFSLINYCLIQTPFKVNSYSMIISNTLITSIVILFFKQILNDRKVIRLISSTEVWIGIGILLYYSGTLPLFILFNKLIASNSPLLTTLLFINDGLNVIMYSLFFTAFLCSPQIQK